MNILITGGCGFVGTNLALYLYKKHKVICLDNLQKHNSYLNSEYLKTKGIYFIDIDIREPIRIVGNIDLIIHCASEPSVLAGVKNPKKVIEINLMGTVNCLELAKEKNANFIFLSTNRVYEVKHVIRTIYGSSKLCAEMMIAEYANLYGFKYIINRCGVIAGEFQRGEIDQGFVGYWITQYLNNGNLNFIGFGGKGEQTRDILYVKDLCKLIEIQINKIEKKNGMIYDVGGGHRNVISLKELNTMVRKETKKRIRIGSINETRVGDLKDWVTNNYQVSESYKWQPETPVAQIVKRTVKWMKENLC